MSSYLPLFIITYPASTKTFGYNPPMKLTGNMKSDMDKIRKIYADKRGFKPENESVVCLLAESSTEKYTKPTSGKLD
jgi:hypothetical protein